MPDPLLNAQELVSDAFANLIRRLGQFADDIKLQCAEAAIDGELERSGSLLESSKVLRAFHSEVEVLATRWSKGLLQIPVTTKKPRKLNAAVNRKLSPHHKSAKSQFRATIEGKTIDQGDASEVFATALERIGLERIAALDKRLSGIALISHRPSTGYQSQKFKGGWYITTHASNADKKRMLEAIGAALKIAIRVDIDP